LSSAKQTLTCPLVRKPRVHNSRQVLGYNIPEPYLHAIQYRKTEIHAEMCKRSFAFFVKEFWSEIDPEELVWNWHLDVLCHEIEVVYRRVFKRQPKEYDLVINVPPGTSKSKIVTIMGPVWGWLNDPTLKTINGSYSGDLSLEHADAARDLIKSRRFSIYFPKLKIRADKDTKGSYQILYQPADEDSWKLGGSRYAASVGGAVTGMHALIINVDDPLNPKKAASDLELKSANHWMEQTLSTRKINKRVTPTILVMQRLHENDPTGKLIFKMKAGKKQVRHICLPGEIKDKKTEALVSPSCLALYYVNKKLDPVRMDDTVLDELMADLGQYGYAAQIQQNPSPPGGGMFKVENFKFAAREEIAEFLIADVVRYWDNAGTDALDNPGSCFTAGVKMGKLIPNNPFYCDFVVLDVVRGQWASEERERRKKMVAELDGVEVKVYVEQEPGSAGKDVAAATVKNMAGFAVYPETSSGDKVKRADPFSVQVNWGKVLLVRAPWNSDYIAELEGFPFGNRKDQVDASGGAFNKIHISKREGGVWGRS
jgi:predicted phage terminase large subunit-like protein